MSEAADVTTDQANDATATDGADLPEVKIEGEFDADRAARTIAQQRKVEAELRAELKAYRDAQKAAEDAEKTEVQRLAEAKAALENELNGMKRSQAVSEALRGAGLDLELSEFVTADEPEAIAQQVAKLAQTIGRTPVTPAERRVPAPGVDSTPAPVNTNDDVTAALEAYRARR